jgi:hypothetical protein
LIGSTSRGVSAALTCEGSLLLELLLAILFPKLHSIVFAFALELISVVTPSEIEGVLDPLLYMVHMLLLFFVRIGLMAASQLKTGGYWLTLCERDLLSGGTEGL